ncbi:MAG: hypothetical protein R3A13_06930 [Bdellovibrionota bacterium]
MIPKSLSADAVRASFKKTCSNIKARKHTVLVVLFPEFDVMDNRAKEYLKLEEHSIIASLAI